MMYSYFHAVLKARRKLSQLHELVTELNPREIPYCLNKRYCSLRSLATCAARKGTIKALRNGQPTILSMITHNEI